MTTEITVDLIRKARQALDDNDYEPCGLDGKLLCYEWEAERLIAGGINPVGLVVIPTKIPVN
jgi:hypothetical protein